MNTKRNIVAILVLFLTAAIWGSSFVFQKYAAEQLPASFVVAGRFTIASILLIVITAKKWKTMDRGCLWGGFLAGFALALGQVLQTLAMGIGTSPGKSAFLTTAYVVMVPFLCWFFQKERPKKNHLLSAVICLIGIGLISLNGGGGLMLGDGVTLVCSVVYALNIIAIAVYSPGRDPIVYHGTDRNSGNLWMGWCTFHRRSAGIGFHRSGRKYPVSGTVLYGSLHEPADDWAEICECNGGNGHP